MSRRAVFRADASVDIGGGHVARCLVLASALHDAGWECVFVVGPGTLDVVPGLRDSGHAILEVGGDGSAEASAITSRHPDGCDLLVIDHYERGEAFEVMLRSWARRLLVIDDLASRPHVCDILLDQGVGRRASAYRSLLDPSTRLLLGPRFALLRSEFREARPTALDRRRSRPGVERVLLSFGSVDQADLTSLGLRALASIGATARVDVVLGASAPHLDAVHRLFAGLGLEGEVLVGVSHMAPLLEQADLALGAGGVSALERCCLGLPSVLVVAAENQREQARGLEARGAATVVGSAGEPDMERLAAAVEELVRDDEARARMSLAAAEICDGLGSARVVDALVPRAKDGDRSGAVRHRR